MTDRKQEIIGILMPEAEEIARETAGPDPELMEELLSEGYLGLVAAVDEIGAETDPGGEEQIEEILLRVREAVEAAARRRDDTAMIDRHLIGWVEQLSASIDRLTEELGAKPNIDEIANEMGISQERVLAILKLTGEDRDDRSYFPPEEP